ncbi:MAG: adenylate/guanylate cyclase domain-containing protein [Hydrogenophaga sp.]|uniref:CHASE2 domain-containing protein n=1 Tax=Hydrogenophaga sp. TaxID=1904254 RepID=UPI00271CA76C|nr:adenylate/guanylate cyclase domain-containing protein [Hydrogenophaga sp.]MDO9483868.1 adenylate/guanylate cyclase domain-containing protein [Hydrogenophaga sp.]MDP3344381.1 adenylate/guanylate cyclase domain-containing protein [Hydrogenophaga sp.]MDP3806637.1 adenylate/guanylate cyclase domain-containing protein [Hydrogenophaga sp.]MDP3925104.1 adenylate/guanylate cyclase domain-containing protein [Hydrogenophaga sp.]MDZ4126716.1 adenylate/guanylate cyclase domain-containing protein [Hydro
MQALTQHGPRIAVTLLPLILVLLHALGVVPMGMLQRLDDIIYDTRLRATMPGTLDDRVVIVDIDEKSLAEVGRWPWSRNHMARLVDTLFEDQRIALLGFDTVFAEPDDSSGLRQLQQLASGPLADQPGFAQRLQSLQPKLDFDAQFARALQGRPVVLGYYFTSDRDGRTSGVLPEPVIQPEALQGRRLPATRWDGFGANIAPLVQAAPRAGFFNAITSNDGVVRSLPLLAEHEGRYYESLSLAMFRLLLDSPRVEPGFAGESQRALDHQALQSVRLTANGAPPGSASLAIPVDQRVATLVPYRGPGGPRGGSFTYVSAADVLAGRLPIGRLNNKIVLVGTTAPGLLDLRVTPVGETYPGVETHANLIVGLLDGGLISKPDYALGYEIIVLVSAGLVLALALPLLSAGRAVALSAGVVAGVVGLNFWLYLGHGLVLPLASTLVMAVFAFALNMSYGYLVESRSKRELAQLFGTYVPPELVDEMVKHPDRYSMTATTRELTVMFCDMRGFTQLSETMEPTQLQALLNTVFSRLTTVIRNHRGTIDKYMGDCVMAFWGAPVHTPNHATLAVQAAQGMVAAIEQVNREHAREGLPAIGVGIGINTGAMCVGDMGSTLRRSYTVVGDAVNLGARLEGLSRLYGSDIIVSETTQVQATQFRWQELDRVRVKGKASAVTIFTPLDTHDTAPPNPEQAEELRQWQLALQAWREQDWDPCEHHLHNLRRQNEKKVLYRLYAERVALARQHPPHPMWDGTTHFETK